MTNLHAPRRGDSRIARTGFGLHKANGVTLTVGACIARPPKQDWIMHTTNENAQTVGADAFIRPRVAESATPTNCESNLFCANFTDGRGYGFAITFLPLRDIFLKREIFVRPYARIKFTLCRGRFFATLRMTSLHSPCRGDSRSTRAMRVSA